MAEVAVKYERTRPDYPTYGPPDTGETWHEYFTRHKKIKNDKNEEEAVVAKIEVTIEGHEVPVGALPKAIGDVAVMMMMNSGMEVQVRHSQTFEEGAVFKSGKQVGEKRPDKRVDHWAVKGDGPERKVIAVWQGGALSHVPWAFTALEGEWFLDDIRNVTELKKFVKGGS